MEQLDLITSAHQLHSVVTGILTRQEFVVVDGQPKLLLACMPKSGSTWLTAIVAKHFDMPAVRCYLSPHRNEQELDVLALFRNIGARVFFVQQHLRASDTTMRLCRAFSTRVIVLTRNLEDVVISFHDHLLRESTIAPMFYMERDWFVRLSEDKQLDFLIEQCLPWYANFLIGWLRSRQTYPEWVHFVRYEDLVRRPGDTLTIAAKFCGIDRDFGCADLDIKGGVRFNRGEIGRGAALLSQDQKGKIRKIMSYYPDNEIGYSEYISLG